MYITYKNVTVDFFQEDADYNGASNLTITSEQVLKFWEEYDNTPYGEEIVEWLRERDDEEDERDKATEFTTYNTDLQILIWRWMFDQEGETFEVKYSGDSQFWLFHDFNHALNDVFGSEIYVDKYVEEQRIFNALDELEERGELFTFTFEMLEAIHNDFMQRWGHRIDIERVREMCNFDEEEYYSHEMEF